LFAFFFFSFKQSQYNDAETALNSFLHLNGDLNFISYFVKKNSEQLRAEELKDRKMTMSVCYKFWTRSTGLWITRVLLGVAVTYWPQHGLILITS